MPVGAAASLTDDPQTRRGPQPPETGKR